MRTARCIVLVLLLLAAPLVLAAEQQDKPDKEMIRLLEFLQRWDMIKDWDLMRELPAIENESGVATSSRKDFPARKKDISK